MTARISNTLRSLRLTVILIIILASMCLLGVIIPQKQLLGSDAYEAWRQSSPSMVGALEALGLTALHLSPLMIGLWCVFFVNLVLVMYDRYFAIMGLMKPSGPPDTLPEPGGRWIRRETDDPSAFASRLKKAGYEVFENDKGFRALKNRLSPLATLVFHLSFLLVLAGGIISLYTRFESEIIVAEGERFDGKYGVLRPPIIGDVPKSSFALEKVETNYFEGRLLVDFDFWLNTPQGRLRRGVNRPYKDGHVTFVPMALGVAPLFVVMDESGKDIDGAYVKVSIGKDGSDSFHMAGYDFKVRFFYDIDKALSPEHTDSGWMKPEDGAQVKSGIKSGIQPPQEIVSPAVHMEASIGNAPAGEGTVRPGELMKLSGGQSIGFLEYPHWVKFRVIGERGLWLVYTGFTLICLALAARFIFFRKEVLVLNHGSRGMVAASAEYFPLTFEEELDSYLRAGPVPEQCGQSHNGGA